MAKAATYYTFTNRPFREILDNNPDGSLKLGDALIPDGVIGSVQDWEKESQDAIAKLGDTVAKLCSAVAALDATLKASIAKQ